MKQQTARPRFATLQYEVLKELDITVAEYFYLDMVYYLSRDGWCYKSLESIADDMNMSKPGIVRLRDRLIEKGLINKDRKGRVRSSVMYNKVFLQENRSTTKLVQRNTKYNESVIQSSTKNYIENNKEKRNDNFDSSETPNPIVGDEAYANARRKSDEVRKLLSSKLKFKSLV